MSAPLIFQRSAFFEHDDLPVIEIILGRETIARPHTTNDHVVAVQTQSYAIVFHDQTLQLGYLPVVHSDVHHYMP